MLPATSNLESTELLEMYPTLSSHVLSEESNLIDDLDPKPEGRFFDSPELNRYHV